MKRARNNVVNNVTQLTYIHQATLNWIQKLKKHKMTSPRVEGKQVSSDKRTHKYSSAERTKFTSCCACENMNQMIFSGVVNQALLFSGRTHSFIIKDLRKELETL